MSSEEDTGVRARNVNSDDKKTEVSLEINEQRPPIISQGTDHVPVFLKPFVEGLSPKLVNGIIRLVFTVFMVVGFGFIIYLGPLALVLLVLLIQMACFREIINIGYIVYKSKDLPWFRTLSWYLLFTSNYSLFGESLIHRFRILLAKEDFMAPLITYHRFISFCLYCGAIVWFVLSLVKKHYLQQFTLFGWTHVTLLIIVISSHFMMQNIFNGIIWFLVPVSMVICNDIMAYVFGIFFGRTPLIKLSPKKTWEGFIGGGFSTLLWGVLFSRMIVENKNFICPIEYDDLNDSITMDCLKNTVFIPRLVNVLGLKFNWYPFYWHCLAISLFISIIGPFGGFFASGFKRAFNIKDFGDTIPGHGGIMDRFDCQIIIGTFVYFYYTTFIVYYSPSQLLNQVYVLAKEDQVEFFNLLTEGLIRRGHLRDELLAMVKNGT